MDKKEYNRNYYYKRDKTKLDKYRKDYLKRNKQREHHQLAARVRREEKYFKKYGEFRNKENELMVLEFRKPKEYSRPWYTKNKEKFLERLNFNYRAKKLKEYVDNVLNIPNDI